MVAAGDLPFLDKLGMCFPQLSFCTLMHIVCAIQESVLNFHMKDLLFFSHDSFSPSSTLSYAGMCTHTHDLLVIFVLWAVPQYLSLSLPLPMKSPYQESDTCFRKSQKLLLSWPSKVLLQQDFIPESWRNLRSRRLTGDPPGDEDARAGPSSSSPEESACYTVDMAGSHSNWMLTNTELGNTSLYGLVFRIPQETNSCLMNEIGC